MKVISIVSPCFNEIDNVDACYQAVKELFNRKELIDYDYEYIIVDDFSTDGTRDVLKEIAAKDHKVKVIFNARNLGVYRTTFHGLKYVTGDLVVPMLPVDQQDPPSFILNMLEKKLSNSVSVVYGMRYEREEGFIMKSIRRLYYKIVSGFSSINIPKYAGEFQLVDKWVIDELVKNDDYYPYIRGKIAAITSDSIGINYKWEARKNGVTKHNLFDLYDQGINGIISTSILPLRIMVLFGLFLSFSSFLFSFFQIIEFFFLNSSDITRGVPTIIVGLFFLVGILFIFLGVIGEYIGAIHSQIRGYQSPVAMKTFNLKKKS